jgi:hypothetical protein
LGWVGIECFFFHGDASAVNQEFREVVLTAPGCQFFGFIGMIYGFHH